MGSLDDFERKFGAREEAPYEDIVNYVQASVVALGARHNVHVEMQAWAPYGAATGVELTDLFAKEPGNGGGTKVMTLLADLSDELRISVYLRPSSSRNREFYARFGFEDDKRNFGFLARYPKFDDDDDDLPKRPADTGVKPRVAEPARAPRGMRR